MQTHGGFGFAYEYDIERKFRETRLYQVAPISTNLIFATWPSTCSGCPGPSEPCVHSKAITVVTLEHAVAAPFATRQLADLGARVIKSSVLARATSHASTTHASRACPRTSCGSIAARKAWTLDVKHPEQPTVLSRLLAQADVLVQNLAPGAASRLGLSARGTSPAHPRLIVCDISGYGSDGPYRDKKAYDLLIQAEAGFCCRSRARPETGRARGHLRRRHLGRHARVQQHPRGTAAARSHRPGFAHRRLDAGDAHRVDGQPALLRIRRTATGPHAPVRVIPASIPMAHSLWATA
jgi:hypothetical protein